MQISLHEIKHHIQILVIFGFDDVDKSDDVLMTVEFLQEHHLTEGPLSIS